MLKTINNETEATYVYFPRPYSSIRASCIFQDGTRDTWFLDTIRSSFVLPDNYIVGAAY